MYYAIPGQGWNIFIAYANQLQTWAHARGETERFGSDSGAVDLHLAMNWRNAANVWFDSWGPVHSGGTLTGYHFQPNTPTTTGGV